MNAFHDPHHEDLQDRLTDQEVGQIIGTSVGRVQTLQRQGLAAIRRILAVS